MSRRIALRGWDRAAFAKARSDKGWSRGELGRIAGIPDVTILRWENGDTAPDIRVLAKAIRALEIDPATVFVVPAEQRYLGDWRHLRLLTQTQLAAAAQIPTDVLSRLERGQRELKSPVAQALAQALEISVDDVRAAYDRAHSRPAGAPA